MLKMIGMEKSMLHSTEIRIHLNVKDSLRFLMNFVLFILFCDTNTFWQIIINKIVFKFYAMLFAYEYCESKMSLKPETLLKLKYSQKPDTF